MKQPIIFQDANSGHVVLVVCCEHFLTCVVEKAEFVLCLFLLSNNICKNKNTLHVIVDDISVLGSDIKNSDFEVYWNNTRKPFRLDIIRTSFWSNNYQIRFVVEVNHIIYFLMEAPVQIISCSVIHHTYIGVNANHFI